MLRAMKRAGRWLFNFAAVVSLALFVAAAVLWACGGGGEKTAEQPPARDLSLAPAESVARMNDRPMDQPAKQPSARPKWISSSSAPETMPTVPSAARRLTISAAPGKMRNVVSIPR